MLKVTKWLRSALGMFRLAGMALGALAVIFGLIADISGGTTFWSLTPDNWLRVGLVLIALFGVATLFRHEYLLHEISEIWGNEHARSLYQDGIPPFRDHYFQYLKQGDYATVNRFWQAGFVNIIASNGSSDLHIACGIGNAAIADGIIRHGGDPKRPGKESHTPLMRAAIAGHGKVIETLVQHDCALNAKSATHGVSALFIAAAHGRLNVVQILIKEGAQIDSLDHNNLTPLIASLVRSKWDVADFLLDAGANVGRIDGSGATVLDHALSTSAPEEIIKKLKIAGAKSSMPPLKKTGSSFSAVGRIKITWEHEKEKTN